MIKFLAADLHTHTDVSRHGYSTVFENILEAKEAGHFAIGISNHGPALKDGAPEGHFRNMGAIPQTVDGIRVYRGAELNIVDYEGHIDLSEDTIKNRLDYTIASLHEDVITPGSVNDHTNAYLAIAENPLVDIIGHSGTSSFTYDYEKVIPEFGKNGKLVELNEASFRVRKSSIQNCREIARLCRKYKVPVIVSSDAHFCKYIGGYGQVLEMLNSLDFPKELVMNSTRERLETWFKNK